MEQEIWKQIPNFADYEVSNLGRIRSYKRSEMIIMRQYLQTSKTKGDRYIVYLRSREQGRVSRNVDKLVAMAFVDNPYNFPEVLHRDGDGGNNRADNLTWNYNRQSYTRKPQAVKVVETGEIYPSQSMACKELYIDPALMNRVLDDPKKTAGGFHFVHATTEEMKEIGDWL